MKNKKMLAMLLALTVTAAGTPVYAADFQMEIWKVCRKWQNRKKF